ncbi:hypothetical protein ERUR111494_00585 [Erysipelothrix urinaevulpis]|uniref:hypothetical protein n=1 Tax=Erysipelothrix urinaevulpis TaxID=2683717 RepID=UPI00135C09F3|nr:hypothetical protein [Erysipelothrix urinaevulpis]
MIKLEKYHKQKWSKKQINELMVLNKRFKLPYKKTEVFDLLCLQVFQTSLYNKEKFETSYDLFRREHLDMWENMTFNERNFFISQDLNKTKQSLKSFEFEGARIYIPFFNRLMNVLYDQETAILELPQFLKLYENFESELVPITTYGTLPFKANMSFAHFVYESNDQIVLFDSTIKTFFKLDANQSVESIPLFVKSQIDAEKIDAVAKEIAQNNQGAVYQIMHDEDLMAPRLKKKYLKMMKRGKL